MKSCILLLCPVLVIGFAGCAGHRPAAEEIAKESEIYQWNDDGGPDELKVRINLSSQRAYFARGGRPVGWSYIATGREGRNTPAGSYRVTEKIVDKHSNKYGWIENEYGRTIDHDASPGDPVPEGGRYVPAPMPYWMRLTGTGIGMHAGSIPHPGRPVSHGCIRLPKPLAPKLFEAAKVGTEVVIEYGPSHPWEVHPDPLPGDDPTRERTINGLRVVSPDDPWIVWPDAHPRAGRGGS